MSTGPPSPVELVHSVQARLARAFAPEKAAIDPAQESDLELEEMVGRLTTITPIGAFSRLLFACLVLPFASRAIATPETTPYARVIARLIVW